MNVHFKSFCLVVLAVAVASCHSHDEGHSHEKQPDSGDHGASEHHSGSSSGSHGLALNGEDKWQMDSHTRAMFTKMVERLEGSDLQSATVSELKASGALLRSDIDELIAGCTMVGAAHDELHKYLSAYIPSVDSLAKSGDLESAGKVHDLLESYPDFFE